MSAADLLATIQESGATIWAEDGRLKFQGLPARLIPAVREHKTKLLALLSDPAPAFAPLPSDQCPDEYARLERAAIQAESMNTTTPAIAMLPAPRKPPQRVSCGECAEFEEGPTHWARGVGRCSRTADGLPPVASRGYGACYPDAPRSCPDYKPFLED